MFNFHKFAVAPWNDFTESLRHLVFKMIQGFSHSNDDLYDMQKLFGNQTPCLWYVNKYHVHLVVDNLGSYNIGTHILLCAYLC